MPEPLIEAVSVAVTYCFGFAFGYFARSMRDRATPKQSLPAIKPPKDDLKILDDLKPVRTEQGRTPVES